MKNLCVVLLLLANPSFSYAAQGPHGGELLKHEKTDYEVVRNGDELKLYVVPELNPAPHQMFLKIKRQNGKLSRISLGLNPETAPGSPQYHGKIPGNIYISGGIKFELDF